MEPLRYHIERCTNFQTLTKLEWHNNQCHTSGFKKIQIDTAKYKAIYQSKVVSAIIIRWKKIIKNKLNFFCRILI